MDFQTLLRAHDIALTDTALCLHKPGDPAERSALALIAETEPDLFETYQSTHPATAEATLKKRAHMTSFLTRGAGEMTFMGLYARARWTQRSAAELAADPRFQALFARIPKKSPEADSIAQRLGGRAVFDLRPLPALASLRGRLVVRDPGARAYMRLAEKTPLPIVEITRAADLSPAIPDWHDLVLDAATVRALPRSWADTLRHWRGLYLILDQSDGARYVGAAYGQENLLGRWLTHVSGETGITTELARRDPSNFLFSILDLLSPTATIDDVTRAEQQWMQRLDTKNHGLNR